MSEYQGITNLLSKPFLIVFSLNISVIAVPFAFLNHPWPT